MMPRHPAWGESGIEPPERQLRHTCMRAHARVAVPRQSLPKVGPVRPQWVPGRRPFFKLLCPRAGATAGPGDSAICDHDASGGGRVSRPPLVGRARWAVGPCQCHVQAY